MNFHRIHVALIGFLFLSSVSGMADDWKEKILTSFGPSWVEKKTEVQVVPNIFTDPDSMNSLRLPMCFFFDEKVEEDKAEEKIRFLTRMYSACGIRLEPRAFTLKRGYSTDPAILLEQARRACPFANAQGARGSIQIETPIASVPQAMCNDSNAVGCSTLCEPVSVSIVLSNSGNRVAFHESLHQNCCGSLCLEEGQGAGDAGKWGIEFSTKSSGLFENRLCDSLRKGASDLSISQWTAPLNGKTYLRKFSVDEQVDLSLGKSLLPQTVLPASLVADVTGERNSRIRSPASLPPYILKTSEAVIPLKLPGGAPHKQGESMRKVKETGLSISDMYETSEN